MRKNAPWFCCRSKGMVNVLTNGDWHKEQKGLQQLVHAVGKKLAVNSNVNKETKYAGLRFMSGGPS